MVTKYVCNLTSESHFENLFPGAFPGVNSPINQETHSTLKSGDASLFNEGLFTNLWEGYGNYGETAR